MVNKLSTLALVGTLSLSGCGVGHIERGIIREESFHQSTNPDSLDVYTAWIESSNGSHFQTRNFGENAVKIRDKYDLGNVVLIQKYRGQSTYSIIDF